MSGRDAANIVLIMADQFASDVVGALGHPIVRTPNIDRLVRSGVSFTNCYCNSPLCVPARASLMTSRRAADLDVFDNGSELRSTVATFPHRLRVSGYVTALAGKMHFIGPDQHHGFEDRLTPDFHTPEPLLTPDWRKGSYANVGTGVRRLLTPGECRWNRQMEYDERVLEASLEYLRVAASDSLRRSPFFLCASFTQPHDPFVAPEPFWGRYRNAEVPMPATPPVPFKRMHPFNQWIQIHHELDTTCLSADIVRDNRRAYYAMVSYIDDAVGRIVGELERMGLRDETLVVFTSDHGEMLGEHGMWFKRTFFDPAMKVPLVVSLPGRCAQGVTRDEVISLVDLGPTLVHLAHHRTDTAPEPDGWISTIDGASFHPMLDPEWATGRSRMPDGTRWKDEVLFEYCGEGPIEPMVGIRRGEYKYVRVHGHRPVLFDLRNDPHERTSLAGSPEHAKAAAALNARLAAVYDTAALRNRVRASQADRLVLLETPAPGRRGNPFDLRWVDRGGTPRV